jgi:hypothetical protein
MRKIFYLIFLITVFYNYSYSQNISDTSVNRKASIQAQQKSYLLKAKRQKTVAYILFGTGLTVAMIGSLSNFSKGLDFSGRSSGRSSTGVGADIAGGLIAASSIPLFISSSKNKKRAAMLDFKMGLLPVPKMSQFAYVRYPEISVDFNFK